MTNNNDNIELKIINEDKEDKYGGILSKLALKNYIVIVKKINIEMLVENRTTNEIKNITYTPKLETLPDYLVCQLVEYIVNLFSYETNPYNP